MGLGGWALWVALREHLDGSFGSGLPESGIGVGVVTIESAVCETSGVGSSKDELHKRTCLNTHICTPATPSITLCPKGTHKRTTSVCFSFSPSQVLSLLFI
jgi:hypothetical protein